MGALYETTLEQNWKQYGTMTPAECADFMREIWEQAAPGQQACGIVPAPFWDDNEDVDDELPIDAQPWYGTVPNPEAAPDELDFVENAAIWAMTGFLAIATWEVGAAPAVLFHTIAPKFVLAMRRGDLGEIIRILVDGEEAARIDTTSAAPDTVIRVPIVADPTIETGHDIAIIQVS